MNDDSRGSGPRSGPTPWPAQHSPLKHDGPLIVPGETGRHGLPGRGVRSGRTNRAPQREGRPGFPRGRSPARTPAWAEAYANASGHRGVACPNRCDGGASVFPRRRPMVGNLRPAPGRVRSAAVLRQRAVRALPRRRGGVRRRSPGRTSSYTASCSNACRKAYGPTRPTPSVLGNEEMARLRHCAAPSSSSSLGKAADSVEKVRGPRDDRRPPRSRKGPAGLHPERRGDAGEEHLAKGRRQHRAVAKHLPRP